MNRKITAVFILSFTLQPLLAQIKMEPGYFIDNQDKRVDCFIRNTDTQANPTSFEFSMTADGVKEKRNLGDAKEFGITGRATFMRFTVQTDTSDQRVGKWSRQRAPEWKTQTIFLKLLVQGKVRLFYWSKGDLTLFFYSKNGEPVKQLVYKRYMLGDDKNQYADNLEYISDLQANVNCKSSSIKEVSATQYKESSLVKYFISNNQCMGDTSAEVIGKGMGSGKFHMAIRPGVNFNSYSVVLDYSTFFTYLVRLDFPSTTAMRLGVELEQVFGFGANKWSVVMEPTYQSMSGQASFKNPLAPLTPYQGNLDYKSLEIPLVVRYYIFLNDDSRIFLNGGLCFDIPMGSKLTVDNTEYELSKSVNLAFGAGFAFKKFSIEARGYTTRNLLSAYTIDNTYKNFSVIAGYRLF